MGSYLNSGNAGFKTIVNGIYVDKTGMIDFINGTIRTPDKLTCVSRPRRFGKSFAAKMLCAYYDKSCDSREHWKKFMRQVQRYAGVLKDYKKDMLLVGINYDKDKKHTCMIDKVNLS